MVGDTYFRQIDQILRAATSDAHLFEAIVNAPFHDMVRAARLDLGAVVFLLANKKTNMIDRISLSNTDSTAGAVRMSEKPFHEIKIPVGYTKNAIAQAIQTGEPQFVSDWKYLFIPALDARAARFNQAGAGIEFSAVYPLKARDGGALIFSYYQVDSNVGKQHRAFMHEYADAVDSALSTGLKAPGGTKQ